jgi:DNA polymerase III alpha subunit
VAYAIQCYRCLYLKTHYPSEWWSSVLNTCNRKKQPKYIQIAKSEGAEFGALDINKLSIKFDVVDGHIVPGLLGIKGIGTKMTDKVDVEINDIVDIDDFVNRQINNKIFMERVILLGAFDKIHKNRKATWYWYLYKYGTTDIAKELRNRINKDFEYTPEQIEEIREQMYLDHKKKHPKSKKIPKRILNYKPKPDPTREQVMAYVGDEDYTYEEILEFQKEFLDYHWDSPMEIYAYRGGCGIEEAKESGILECVISTCESRRTNSGTKFMTLTITDGKDFGKIQIWSNTIDEYGEDFFSPGNGINIKVTYNEKYKSFNLKKDQPIAVLPKKEEHEKRMRYLENTEVFPDLRIVEDDFLGEFD